MRFSIYQDTAIGARTVNQDRMGYCFTRDSLLILVADGMGGHMRGEVAAQIACQTTAGMFQTLARPALDDPAEFLDLALRRAHRDILRYQVANAMPESPRTTVVGCVVQNGQVWWAHAGDSRFYLLRDGALVARTLDHSKVQTMVTMGLITPEEQEHHPERNKVLNCLGSPFEPTIEIAAPLRLQPGDRLLLCSDGLWSGFAERDLCVALAAGPLATTVPEMIQHAVMQQGRSADNTTAVAMAWEGESESMSSTTVPEGAITTTIAIGQPGDEPVEEISEDEIERTIREIRSAIDRTQNR